jgi:cell division protein FtsL
MMRGLSGTILWTCLAGAIGVGLFSVKHEVKDQELRLSHLNQDIQREQEAIHVLKAEWSYLNDPARLRALSEKHLGMQPVAPGQVATLDSLNAQGQPAFALAKPAAKQPTTSTVAKAEPPKAPPARPVLVAGAPRLPTHEEAR